MSAVEKIKDGIFPALLHGFSLCRSTLLARTTFVVVTGSCGKTTVKELAAAALKPRFRVFKSPENRNTMRQFARFMFGMRPSHECCVIEVAGATRFGEPADLDTFMARVRPDIAVVTTIGLDHYSVFRDRDHVAALKGKVVDALSPRGIAVLNADDPYVLGMRSRCTGRVITYGQSNDAMVRAHDVDSSWPAALSFVVTCGDQRLRVETKLHGTHLVGDVLATIAVAHAMGVPLEDALRAIAGVKPFEGRMQASVTAEGIGFMRDAAKAPFWTLPLAVEYLRTAQSKRKVLVLGTISDYPGDLRRHYSAIAQEALGVVDAMVGVGTWATAYLRARPTRPDQVLRACSDWRMALEFLRGYLEPGDLVLLKGSGATDNLDQIFRQWASAGAEPSMKSTSPAPLPAQAAAETAADRFLIVGLGNPGPEYDDTPHNVGRQTVEALARQLGASWRTEQGATIAEASHDGKPLYLVKLHCFMNDSGPALVALATRLGVKPEHCTMVFDDIDLPLGRIRSRSSGSAGGHKGVESVLVAFQSQRIPRIKIGVGRPADGDVKAHVIRKFPSSSLAQVTALHAEAGQSALKLLNGADVSQPTAV